MPNVEKFVEVISESLFLTLLTDGRTSNVNKLHSQRYINYNAIEIRKKETSYSQPSSANGITKVLFRLPIIFWYGRIKPNFYSRKNNLKYIVKKRLVLKVFWHARELKGIKVIVRVTEINLI